MPEPAEQPVRDTMTVDPASAATPMPTGKWGPGEVITAKRADTAPAEPAPAKDVQVPGYEILGVLGRGGMGVVYKARQRGLDRPVALKMVVSGAHAGPEQLARFRSEAAALGKLIHSNIVQVYEIGECGGLPYFSLEYVDGSPLDKRIAGKPQPPREAALLVATLARAMQFAHERGIIHRDLKPANVLVTSDGVPKITDFGLAKRLEEGDSGMTRTGTIMGTPSYMAPEQARGDVRGIGPDTDLYSLGAILYELLTGEPPFTGESPIETMNLVLMLDPTPPSRLQPEVPLDLETICLKCLQKESRHRYPNCFALAEDLHRFLAGEPIQARPVSRAERLWRWCKRNPRVAMLAASTLVLLLAGVIVSSVAAWTIAQERNQKELERQAAEAARGLAEERKIEADRANEQAQRNAQLALKQSGLALGAYGALIDEVQRVIGDSPGTQEVKLKLLETALAGLDKVAKSDENARLLDQSMAAAYMKMGQLFQQLGQSEKAITQYEKCHEIIRARAEKDPEGDVAQANLAATYTMLGAMSLELKRDMQASLEYYQKALAIRKKLNSRTLGPKLDATKVRQDLTESLTRIGVTFLRLGEAKEARPYFQEALALRQELANQMPNDLGAVLDVARSLNALGDVEFKSRNASIAKGYYEQAVQLNERVQQEDKDNPKATWELANTLGNYAVFEMRTGNLAPAQKLCTRYRTLMQELVDLDPKNSNYLRYLGLAHYRMATIARRLDDAPTAERCNRACLEIREKLVAADEKNERRPVELMLVLPRCGQHARAAELAAKIQQRPNIDREELIEVAQCYSQCAAAASPDSNLSQQYIEKALRAIDQAIGKGYKDVVVLETEPDLGALRGRTEFQALLARLKDR